MSERPCEDQDYIDSLKDQYDVAMADRDDAQARMDDILLELDSFGVDYE